MSRQAKPLSPRAVARIHDEMVRDQLRRSDRAQREQRAVVDALMKDALRGRRK